ncbi:MAG TPA: HAMP domain-containing sensor histidine kinase [Streptosporangiaceae bacterium]|nr:HAMP domain-containing sensor histidine kinase [Streptosporangiaceae bacterium]
MTRRIVLAILSLLAAVLGAVAIPLGLLTAAQDRRDYTDETKSTASTLVNMAEERLGDRSSAKVLDDLVAGLRRHGDRIGVFDQAGSKIAGTAKPPLVTAGQLSRARTGAETAVYDPAGYVVVVAPIRADTGRVNIGAVALARPASPVEHRVAMLWLLIGGVSAVGLLAGALVAIGLARWARRPLGVLGQAAQQFGGGQLSTRSPADSGPVEVRRLAANFNLMAARLEALVHGHQAAMADVSHQLRTPLAALRLRLELLAQDSDDDSVAAELAGAQEEIARLSRLVNGLLAVARAENLTAAPAEVPVDSVVASRVAAWLPAAEEHGIALTADSPGPVRARITDGLLEQILDNLIANAIEALSRGGDITISAAQAGGYVRITVADNGPGMTAEHKRSAFRRFAVSGSGGTGLGLAIVYRLVTSSGGSAALSDTEGGGLTVTIDLPAVRPERVSRRLAGAGRPGTHGRRARAN